LMWHLIEDKFDMLFQEAFHNVCCDFFYLIKNMTFMLHHYFISKYCC